jgi:hypothetical protein
MAAGRGRETEPCEAPPAAAAKAKRMVMNHLPAGQRKGTFEEINLGFTEEQALEEARRCLRCGVCDSCYRCDSAKASGTKTVAEYLKAQRRFRHLTDVEIEKIQERVNREYLALLERCGVSKPAQ